MTTGISTPGSRSAFKTTLKTVASVSGQTYRSRWFWALVGLTAVLASLLWVFAFLLRDWGLIKIGSSEVAALSLVAYAGMAMATCSQYQWRLSVDKRSVQSLLRAANSLRLWRRRAAIMLFVYLLWTVSEGLLNLVDSGIFTALLFIVLFSITVNLWSWSATSLAATGLLKSISWRQILVPHFGLIVIAVLMTVLWFLLYFVIVTVPGSFRFMTGAGIGGLFIVLSVPAVALATVRALGADTNAWHLAGLDDAKGASDGLVAATRAMPRGAWMGLGGAAALLLAFYAGSIINTPAPISETPEVADGESSQSSKSAEPTVEDTRAQKADQARRARAHYDAKEYDKAYSLATVAAAGEDGNTDAQLLLFQLGPNPAGLEAFKLPKNGTPRQIAAAAQKKLDMSPKAPITARQGINWLIKAVEQGHVKANANLGAQYLFGSSVIPKNYQTALKYIRFAAEGGSDHAQKNLGYMYENGYGVAKNMVTSFNWYKRSADGGDKGSMYTVGWRYNGGSGVAKSLPMAFRYFKKAAEAGYAGAQSELGYRLMAGIGTPKNYQSARYWLAKAAAQDDALAYNNLGSLYNNGYGVRKDEERALKLFMIASKLGDMHGAYNTANTMWGMVKHDARYIKMIRNYYNLAKERGHPDAANQLARYNVGANFVSAVQGLAMRTMGPLISGDAKALEGIMNEQYHFIDGLIEQAVKQ